MNRRARWAAFSGWYGVVLLVVFALGMGAAAGLDPRFVDLATQRELASHVWELAILALPMTLILVSGGIDLSVGSTLALASVCFGLSMKAGAPPAVAALAALATGAAAGYVNGLCVTRLRVHPLIVTLATLAAYRGIAEGISLGRPFSGFPESFVRLARDTVAGVPVFGLLCVSLVLVAHVWLKWTAEGRVAQAIGFNERAVRYSGLNVDRLKVLLYTASGFAAGLASIMMAARHNTAKADLGTGLELEVITAVVLGGTSIFGGRGSIPGAMLGVLLIHETREFVSWHWQRDEINLVVVGLLLIGAAGLHRAFASLVRGRKPCRPTVD